MPDYRSGSLEQGQPWPESGVINIPSLDDIVAGASTDAADDGDDFEVDFSGAVDFEVLPKDDYLCEVLSVESGTSKQGNPKLIWTFVVTEGTHKNRQLKLHTNTSGKGSGRAKQVLKACGVTLDGERIRFKRAQVVGSSVKLAVDIQTDNPDFNDIRRVSAA